MKSDFEKGSEDLVLLLGLPFHNLTIEEALSACEGSMNRKNPEYFVTANVDFTLKAYHDDELRQILFFAEKVICDGKPLVWVSRFLGFPLRERVAGADLVLKLIERCAILKKSIYFLGSDDPTCSKAKSILIEKYPGLQIVGHESPPKSDMGLWNHYEIRKRIRNAKPDLLLVALGCPKQEKWIAENYKKTGVPLSIGIGASIDYIAGKQKRAPLLFQKIGLEWFWRMLLSPRRLASRYKADLIFLLKATYRQRQLMKSQRKNLRNRTLQNASTQTIQLNAVFETLVWKGSLERAYLDSLPWPKSWHRPIVCQMNEVFFIDSSGLGKLALLARTCKKEGQPFAIYSPSNVVAKSIYSMRLEKIFPMYDDLSMLNAYIETEKSAKTTHQRDIQGGTLTFEFPINLVTENEAQIKDLLNHILNAHKNFTQVVLVMTQVEYMDSSGIAFLLRFLKEIERRNIHLFLANLCKQPKSLIHLLKLEKILKEDPEYHVSKDSNHAESSEH